MLGKPLCFALCGILFALAACGTAPGSGEGASVDTSAQEMTVSDEVPADGSDEMNHDEIAEVAAIVLGDDYEEYIEDEEGIKDGVFCSVYLRIRPEREDDALSAVESLCGEGVPAASRDLPAMQDRVCDRLRASEPVSVYDYLRQGDGGAKTKSTEIYTARQDGALCLFIFQ